MSCVRDGGDNLLTGKVIIDMLAFIDRPSADPLC